MNLNFKSERIKELILLSDTNEEADGYIEKYTGFKSTREKFAFLTGLFGVEIVGSYDESTDNQDDMVKADYEALLVTVLHRKYMA